MKIIFLDIDGVLNSVDSMVAANNLRRPAENPRLKLSERRLDHVCIGILKRICDESGAHIVVSSVWRLNSDINRLKLIFSYYGWKDIPILGVTEVLRSSSNRRGMEIQAWLDSNPQCENYIILDDDSDMLEHQQEHFVHVSNISGLRAKHFCQALRILGHQYPDEWTELHLSRLEKQVNFVNPDRG